MTQSIFNSQSVSPSVSQSVSQSLGAWPVLGSISETLDSDRTSALLTSHCRHWCELNYAISGNWIKPGWFSQWPVQSLGLDEPAVIEPKSSFITHRSITVLIWVTFNVTKSSHIISKIKIRSTINKCKWFHVWKFHCSNQVRVSINFDLTLVLFPPVFDFGCCCLIFVRLTQQIAPRGWSNGLGGQYWIGSLSSHAHTFL